MLADLGLFRRYRRSLGAYLSEEYDLARCEGIVRAQLAARDETFLDVLRRGVYERPGSPYLRLLDHAGVELGDVERTVRESGVEAALAELYDAGVHLTLEEARGRVPIERGDLSFTIGPAELDNPLIAADWTARSGGSRGTGRPVLSNFQIMTHDTAYWGLFVDAFGVRGRPITVWYPLPPGVAGLKTVLMDLKTGVGVDRWLTQSRLRVRVSAARPTLLTASLVVAARRRGLAFRFPRYVPPERAVEVARRASPASARRACPGTCSARRRAASACCLAAQEHGLDLEGTLFRFGGEALTPGKAAVIEAAGGRAACNYYAAEAGLIGIACAEPAALGDVHLATDKLGVLVRPKTLASGEIVDVLVYTSLLPVASKILLNVETDDYGTVERRSCGCPVGALGLDLHLHTIRSHEKLTSEGMSFLGSAAVALVEEVLPGRFGGSPTDYQLVEDERGGLTRISIRVSPGVGPVDDAAVVEAALAFLGSPAGPSR